MFVKSFGTSFSRAMPLACRALASHVRANWAVRVAACATRAHFLVTPSSDRATGVHASSLSCNGSALRSAVLQIAINDSVRVLD